ncbi:hypothetical protein FPZ12_029525 [Amycolatopsis acidicola]|uniref:Uncharacterized protein n=1 Tax=Amycolatopsis acidicola TaxID=2596893 RepID=A0A5N0UWW7_9PSEU|nr:hypothetical protein [Amycolatopsis acidicola]KAA9155538.1 hypothetical protein FPZ12_029525 [Amycolatopsis acidicola]
MIDPAIHAEYLAARHAYGDAFNIIRDRELDSRDLAFGARYGLISPASFGRRVEWRIAEAFDLFLEPASAHRGDATNDAGRAFEIKASAAASGTAIFNQIRLAEPISRYLLAALDADLGWHVFVLTHEQLATEPLLRNQHSRTHLKMIRLPVCGEDWLRWSDDYEHVVVGALEDLPATLVP